MINKVILVGRLTDNLELRTTSSGNSTVTFNLAVNRAYKKEGQPDADFIRCVAWNKTADNMVRYLSKGSMIGVEGRIQVRSYQDRNGQNVYVTEVICDNVSFLETKKSSQQNQQRDNGSYYTQDFDNPVDEELPF